MEICEYNPGYLKEIARLFYDTVHTICAIDYSWEQLDAWASGKIDEQDWNRRFEEHYSMWP